MNSSKIESELEKFVIEKGIEDRVELKMYGKLIDMSIYPYGKEQGRFKINETSIESIKVAITYILNLC